jgi:hypothetical protein
MRASPCLQLTESIIELRRKAVSTVDVLGIQYLTMWGIVYRNTRRIPTSGGLFIFLRL